VTRLTDRHKVGDIVVVTDRMQSSYSYKIEAPTGHDFASEFKPHFTPKQMLETESLPLRSSQPLKVLGSYIGGQV